VRSWTNTIGRIPAGWWVALLVLPALVPLARAGFFESHDGLLHVYRLAALDHAVRAGVLYPRWFPEFGFGYGQPVLNFYGPLAYYWGLPFTLLGANAALALELVFATGLIASALAMYLFARLHLSRGAALVAAVVYAYLPYHLVDLYVRGAVAEFLAFVWFPLVLWAFHRLIEDGGRRTSARVGLAALLFAALILTHSLSAFIFTPVLVIYVLILFLRQRDRRALGQTVLALAGAVALTAFYWLPVLAESRYVGLGHGASQGYREHLLSWSGLLSWSPVYPYPGETGVTPVFPLGLVQVLIVAAAGVLAISRRGRSWVALLFLGVALVSGFMLTSASLPIWRALEPALAFLQYPWRFQALTVVAGAFLAGFLVQSALERLPAVRLRGQILVGGGLLLAVGMWALWLLPVVPMTPDLSVEAMWQQDRANGQIGATWTGEYLPIWVTEQRWAISLPASQPVPGGDPLTAGQVQLDGVGYNRYDLSLETTQDTPFVLHQFYYPGFQARGQGTSVLSQPQGVLGLATFDLPAGDRSLSVRLGLTLSQRWGAWISLAFCLVAGIVLVSRYQLDRARSARPAIRPYLGSLTLAAGFLLLAAVLIAHLALPNGYIHQVTPVNADLEDTVELLSFGTDRAAYHAGDAVEVTLYWRALRSMDRNYKAFVHLTNADMTAQPAQHDGDPGGGFSPTTRWLPGELVPDAHSLALPADLAPGRYRLWAGMYESETVRNLTVFSSSVPSSDNRVLLGEIEVTAP
jgi:hypothetical protein